jgi:CRISPR type IV-associated protein Csf3
MKPLRVEIHLVEPIVPSSFPRLLDGLLAHCAVEDALSYADDSDTRPVRELGENLPLAQLEGCDPKVWKASAFMPIGRITATGDVDHLSVTGATHLRMFNRKSDVFEIARLTGLGFLSSRGLDLNNPQHGALQLDTGRSLLKESHITYPLKMVHAVEAWCIGDQDHVEALLNHVEFLGAKRRLGHGKVRRISVAEDERADDLWALRPIPASALPPTRAHACQNRTLFRVPPRAPYWDLKNAVDQLVPNALFW